MDFKKKETAVVVANDCLSQGIYSLTLKCESAKYSKAGQFVGVYPKNGAHLLMRPISICESNKEESTLRLVFRIVGKGTDEFAKLAVGESVEILGCLGNGFPVSEAKGKTVVLMGGGIGVPPMVGCAENIEDADVHSFIGYRNADTFLVEDFEKVSTVHIATEDGSIGTKGNVLDALAESEVRPDVIMACGPMPMLRAIKKYAEENNIVAYISLEERMACGVGACLGCVCRTTKEDHHSHVNNARVCTEGPVFDAREVDI